jgi:hypothetical protein
MAKEYEHCCVCDDLTGRAGRADDSRYCEQCDDIGQLPYGPFCDECFEEHTKAHD